MGLLAGGGLLLSMRGRRVELKHGYVVTVLVGIAALAARERLHPAIRGRFLRFVIVWGSLCGASACQDSELSMIFRVDNTDCRLATLAIIGVSLQDGLTATQLAFWALSAGLPQHVARRF